MNEKKRFYLLLSIFSILMLTTLTVWLIGFIQEKTYTRFIQQEKDELKGYYTALHFSSTGEGNAIALDNNVGYTDFKLMNYAYNQATRENEVTNRNITYEVKTVEKFYDNKGNLITSDLSSCDEFYVLDVWGQPKLIGEDTYKYDVEIISSDGQKNPENQDQYIFNYQNIDGIDIGLSHNLSVKLTRKDTYKNTPFGSSDSKEQVSIVVQLDKPYREVHIINITVLERLIVFSNKTTEQFEISTEKLQIQTVGIFSHLNNALRTANGYYFTSNPLKVTLEFNDIIMDYNSIARLPNYMVISNTSSSLVLNVYESSDFSLDFLTTSTSFTIKVKVEIIVKSIETDQEYILIYDSALGGFHFDKDGYILVANQDKSLNIH